MSSLLGTCDSGLQVSNCTKATASRNKDYMHAGYTGKLVALLSNQ